VQTSQAVTSHQLADDLQRFIAHCMKGEQTDLFELIAQLDLTVAQMRGLFVLDVADHALALTELAPRMGLSIAAAGRAVDGLVRHGFVSRSEDTVDRRIKRIALTKAGRAALGRINEARLVGLRRFAETLGDRERDALAAGLAAVFTHLDAQQTEEEAP